MIRLTAGAYLGVLLVFTQQAQRAESVVNPSWLTITLAGALVALTSLLALRILTRDTTP